MPQSPQITNGLKVCFSSAHRYLCPGLTEDENKELYGNSYSVDGLGHNFELSLFFEGELDKKALAELIAEFDHKYLNEALPDLSSPLTTETLALLLAAQSSARCVSSGRIRFVSLSEGRDLWAQANTEGAVAVFRRYILNCVHRHHNPNLTGQENAELYGKCSELHGHEYAIEVGLSGSLSKSGLVWPRPKIENLVSSTILQPFDKTYLNEKIGNTSGEIIAQHFYTLLKQELPEELSLSLRLCETHKNSFLVCDDVFLKHFDAN